MAAKKVQPKRAGTKAAGAKKVAKRSTRESLKQVAPRPIR